MPFQSLEAFFFLQLFPSKPSTFATSAEASIGVRAQSYVRMCSHTDRNMCNRLFNIVVPILAWTAKEDIILCYQNSNMRTTCKFDTHKALWYHTHSDTLCWLSIAKPMYWCLKRWMNFIFLIHIQILLLLWIKQMVSFHTFYPPSTLKFVIFLLQWNVAYPNAVYPNTRLSEQVTSCWVSKNGCQQKEENCSQRRPEATNLQTTEERGFHYFTFKGVGP